MKYLTIAFTSLFAFSAFAGEDPDLEVQRAKRSVVELVAEAAKVQQMIQTAENSWWKTARQCDIKKLVLLSTAVTKSDAHLNCCPNKDECCETGCWHRGLDSHQVEQIKAYVGQLAAYTGNESQNSKTIASQADGFVKALNWAPVSATAATDQFWKTIWFDKLSARSFWNAAHKPFEAFNEYCEKEGNGPTNTFCQRVRTYSTGVAHGFNTCFDCCLASGEFMSCGRTIKCNDECQQSCDCNPDRCNILVENKMPGAWWGEAGPIYLGEMVGNTIGYLGGRVLGTATLPLAACAGSCEGHVHRTTARAMDAFGSLGRYSVALPLAVGKFGLKTVSWFARGATTLTSAVLGGVIGPVSATIEQAGRGLYYLGSKTSVACQDNLCT